ncbi:MAG: radical SAM protein, partial [Gemmatimonadota bacterium]|nr:radical SAM protein [Gemmatimonadota bacterium]
GRVYCVSFELTYNCNARCQHCHRGPTIPKERLASADRLVEICRQIRPIVSVMSGGEPLIRNDLEDIVSGFKETGASPRVNVNTNAALLTPKRFQSLKEAGLDNFVISFDFPDERHDEWRAIPGLFGKIERLVTGLSDEDKKRVALTCVFNARNFRDAPRMAEVAREWGVCINFSAYTWLRTQDMDLLIQPEELDEARRVVAELSDMRRKHGHVVTSDGVLEGMLKFYENRGMPGCRAGERLLVVNPDGTFSPCGLHITDYPSREALLEGFTRNNECSACYTISRAMTERPLWYLVRDHLHHLRTTGPNARIEA